MQAKYSKESESSAGVVDDIFLLCPRFDHDPFLGNSSLLKFGVVPNLLIEYMRLKARGLQSYFDNMEVSIPNQVAEDKEGDIEEVEHALEGHRVGQQAHL